MRRSLKWGNALGLGCLLAALAAQPGLAQSDWNQAYGNIGNTSFMNTETRIGVAPRWAVSLHAPVEWGGPAIGPDGTVYLGTTIGTFYGIRPDGSGRCGYSLAGAMFASTPAVLPNGNVAFLLHRQQRTGRQTALLLLTPDCMPIWERELPRWTPEKNSTATGSVKVWTQPRTGLTFLFVHSTGTRQMDVTMADTDTPFEILVYDTTGELFARHHTGKGCVEVEGGGGWESFGDIWDALTSWWPTVGSVPPLYEQFGWPDSTPAILDAEIPGYSTPSSPLVAVTDHRCNVEFKLLQFSPSAATFEGRLVKTWGKTVDSEGALLSSPAVLPDGTLIIGSSTHRLRAYDLATRTLRWETDTKQPVMHPPAITPDRYYTTTDYLGWIYTPSGAQAVTVRPQPMVHGSKLGANAASLNQAFVPHYKELTIWSPDLQAIAHPLQGEHFVTTNPALTPKGRLYVISQSETGGPSTLFAFGDP